MAHSMVHPDSIVGFGEIAERLEEKPDTIRRLYERRYQTGFPDTVATVGRILVFDMTDVERWHKTWRATRLRRR